MKRIIILLFFLFLTIQPSGALTFEGGVTYTVETARAAAFDGVATKIDMKPYSMYMIDNQPWTNKSSIKNGIYYLGAGYREPRRLAGFYTFGILTTYAVNYKRDPNRAFFYSAKYGTLQKMDIVIGDSKKYPYKIASYSSTGELGAIGFFIAPNEGYVFNKNGKFLSHWIGEYEYTKNGKKIPWSKRKSLN